MTSTDVEQVAPPAVALQLGRPSGSVAPIPLEELDGLISDLHAIGLVLAGCAHGPDRATTGEAVQALRILDQAIARVRGAVLQHSEPVSFGDWTAPGSNGAGLETIESIDAAHSARRAVVILQESGVKT